MKKCQWCIWNSVGLALSGAGIVDIVLVNLNASVWSKNDRDTNIIFVRDALEIS